MAIRPLGPRSQPASLVDIASACSYRLWIVEDRDRLTALVHLYRGELARMTSYRVRLDTTTNWAVGTTAALGSLTLGASSAPQSVLLLLVLLVLFLWMESRRYRTYRISLERVRLLEMGLYAPMVGGAEVPDWRSQLARSLESPECGIPMWVSVGIRLRRNYLGLVAVVVAAWVTKAYTQGDVLVVTRIGPVPGGVVLAMVALATLAMTVLAALAPPAAEDY